MLHCNQSNGYLVLTRWKTFFSASKEYDSIGDKSKHGGSNDGDGRAERHALV